MYGLFENKDSQLSNDVAENPGPDNKVSDLIVFHWNARSVRNKIQVPPQFVFITESHLDKYKRYSYTGLFRTES